MRTNVKIGDKYKYERETRFGKKIVTEISVVAINNNSVLMDNGETFHIVNL